MVAERGGGTPRCNQSAQKNSGYVTDLAQIFTKTTPNLIFLAGFQGSMLGNLINIKNFNWNPVVLKKFY